MMDEEEFEKYQLWRDVKKNYFKNKIGHYTELLDKKEKSVKFIEEEIENNKKVYEGNFNINIYMIYF